MPYHPLAPDVVRAPEALIAARNHREMAVARVELLSLLLEDALERLDDGQDTIDGGSAARAVERAVRAAIHHTAL